MTIIELFEGDDGWRVRLRDGDNGEILATSEAYASLGNAVRAADGWKDRLYRAEIRTA